MRMSPVQKLGADGGEKMPEEVSHRIAAALLEMGSELEEQERKIRQSLQLATDSADLELVRRILAVWNRPAEVPKN